MDKAQTSKPRLDLAALTQQFSQLNGVHPGLWPVLPRILLSLAVLVAMVVLGWFLYWRGLFEEWDALIQTEQQLKTEYVDKMKQAVNLEALRGTRDQVLRYVGQLEKQLPSRAEMDALLSDINQAGVGRGATLQLFRPGQVMVREYYAELPISVRVVGSYHDLAAFASDVSNLPRIVTLNNLTIGFPTDSKSGLLAMDATAKTFRYLDPEEIAQARSANQNSGQRKAGGAP